MLAVDRARRVTTTPANVVSISKIRALLMSVRESAPLPDDLAWEVERCISSLSEPAFISSGDAARLLGYSSINSVKSMVVSGRLGTGVIRSSTGRWLLLLDAVLAAREFNRGDMALPRSTGDIFEESEPEV